jgi:autotransporter-associated beta strand protein
MNISTNANRLRTVIGFFCLAVSVSNAAVITWSNVAGGDFTTAGNWYGGVAPGPDDHARLTNGTLITLSTPYTLSNLWVAARAINNTTSRLEITTGGELTLTGGPNNANNVSQVGVGTNALGRLEMTGGTISRYSLNPANPSWLLIGGGGGTGYFTVSSGNVFLDSMRVGSDNAGVGAQGTKGGFGFMDVSGGLVIVSNQCNIGRDLDTGTLAITGGEVINQATNFFLGTDSDGYMTVAGGSNSGNSTGTVNVATGGILRTYGGIRIGQSSATFIQDGTVKITGGRLTTQRFFQGSIAGTSLAKVEFDGGILEAVLATNASGFIYGNISVKVKSGGITIDSAGYDLPVLPGVLADIGSPGGGLIKSNAGILKLMGTNTYTGATIIQGGGLITTTASSGGGSITANDGSLFGAVVSYPGSSMNLSSLTLNSGLDTNALNFDLRTFNNPTAPVIMAATLAVNRTNKVNISGAPLTVGVFTLIQYTTGTGVTADHFEIGSLPAGVTASIVLEPGFVKLNVTSAPSLHWNGNLSADWDTNTLNWLDFSSITPTPTAYAEGAAVSFDDAAATNFVNLVQIVSPALVTVTNQITNYTFSGVGSLAGATGLKKQGAGTLTVGVTANSYAGDTVISGGTLQLGISDVIPQGAGKGNLTVNGTLDLNGFIESINGLTGAGTIDNTSGNSAVLTTGNNSSAGSFSGTIQNSGGGGLNFTKAGNQTLLLSGNNTHSGGTTLNGGVVQAANNNVLGVGPLTFNGGGLSSDGGNARTFTNSVAVLADSTIGDLVNNGSITLTGPLDFGGTPRTWTARSDVLLTGDSIGAGWNKAGVGVMTLQGAHKWTGLMEVNQGTLIVNGAITNTDGTRADCTFVGSFARMVLNPGSTLVLTGPTTNIRVGNNGAVIATNILDIAGLAFTTSGDADGRLVLGQGSTTCFANLLTNGIVIVRKVEKVGTGNYCEVNLDGGTIQAMTTNTAFMEGLSNVFVKAGGFTLNSASNDVTINQPLLSGGGSGGLTKIGAGALFLNGTNTYTGTTTVNEGGLGGSGIIAGPVLVTSGGTLVPGNSVGTLTINNTLTLEGTTVMEVSREGGVPASDRVIASTLNRGGSLQVTHFGANSLRSGDSFDLFDWTAVSGTFTSVSLAPLLPGLSWNTANLNVNGTINITGTIIPPRITSNSTSGTTLTASGSGGVAGGTYYTLMTTDLALPVTSWTAIATNQFDASGNFTFTDATDIDPQRFYLISIP